MVNVTDIKKKLINLFSFDEDSTWAIDGTTGEVNVQGSVSFVPKRKIYKNLPVKFGTVSGNFRARFVGINSLVNFPKHVGGNLDIGFNRIGSWQAAPATVQGMLLADGNHFFDFEGMPKLGKSLIMTNCALTTLKSLNQKIDGDIHIVRNPLVSLEGFEGCSGQIILDYNTRLPLLRCLLARKGPLLINRANYTKGIFRIDTKEIQNIFAKYVHQGQAGALACAAELSDAGFKENARW